MIKKRVFDGDMQVKKKKKLKNRKKKFEEALKKCPKQTISDEKIVEFKKEGRK